MKLTFEKQLSGNDLGITNSHQSGMLIPKKNKELLNFLPYLDPSIKNPFVWVTCLDSLDEEFKFKFIHYNNKFHDDNGTRDEFRLTHTTRYFRSQDASEGDFFIISGNVNSNIFNIEIKKQEVHLSSPDVVLVRLSGWRKIH